MPQRARYNGRSWCGIGHMSLEHRAQIIIRSSLHSDFVGVRAGLEPRVQRRGPAEPGALLLDGLVPCVCVWGGYSTAGSTKAVGLFGSMESSLKLAVGAMPDCAAGHSDSGGATSGRSARNAQPPGVRPKRFVPVNLRRAIAIDPNRSPDGWFQVHGLADDFHFQSTTPSRSWSWS